MTMASRFWLLLVASRQTSRIKGGAFFFFRFISLFLAALGLHCCTQAFSSCYKWGLIFVALHGLLIVVASLVAEHGV